MAGLVGGTGTPRPVQPSPAPSSGGSLVADVPLQTQPPPKLFPPYEPIIVNIKGDQGLPGKPGEPGAKGEKGETGGTVFEYLMPVAQTTALVEHNLGRDPVAIQVIVDGTVREEYSVSFPLPGATVLVGFDVSVQALIRLI